VSVSTVTVFGARTPLRDGEILRDDEYLPATEQRWYIGGQSPRSYAAAWMLLESLLDAPGWRVKRWPDWSPHALRGLPHHCASLRFGNCLILEIEAVIA